MHQRFFTHVLLPALLLGILANICLNALRPPAALAHAFVIGSDPIDGSTIARAPEVVRIFFNASISPISTAHVYVISQDGQLQDVSASHSTVAGNNLRELDTPLQTPLPQGGYEVKWTAVANDDGYTTFGLIGFNIGHSSTGLSGVSTLGPSTSNNVQAARTLNLIGVLTVAWEWLVLVALTFWVGILVMERFFLTETERSASLLELVKKQALPVQWLCLAALLVGETVILILRATAMTQILHDGSIDLGVLGPLLTQTNYGHLWLLRTALLLLALGLLWWTSRTRRDTALAQETPQAVTRSGPLPSSTSQEQNIPGSTPKEEGASRMQQRYTSVWMLLAGLIVFIQALTSDAEQVAQLRGSAIVFDWLYLVAQCTWFGGLAYLGFVLLPLTLRSDSAAEILAAFLRRFTPLILGSIGVLLISGLFLSESTVSNAQQLLSDPYGRTLLIAIILIAVIILLSAYTFLILRPKFIRQAVLLPVVNAELPARRARLFALEQTERNMKQLLGVQTTLCAAVLLCIAFMSFYAPAIVFPNITYSNPSLPANSTENIQTKQVGNLSLSLQLLPGRVDAANTLVVIINDLNDKSVTDAQVRFTINMETMDMGTTSIMTKGGNPLYVASLRKGKGFSMAGLWDIGVVVQRPGQPPVKTNFQVMVS